LSQILDSAQKNDSNGTPIEVWSTNPQSCGRDKAAERRHDARDKILPDGCTSSALLESSILIMVDAARVPREFRRDRGDSLRDARPSRRAIVET